MEPRCKTQEDVLTELEQVAPGAPLLALGQTPFWDEPMKAGLAIALQELGFDRPFVAGVHDTDYFAKLPSAGLGGGFKAFPHNDTTTRDLWSAAGEFSSLFGGETVVEREVLQAAGVHLHKVARERPGRLDEATEAFGWRGVVALGDESRVSAELPLSQVFPALQRTLDWAIDASLECIVGDDSTRQADRLRTLVCDAAEAARGATLSEFYKQLIPRLFEFAAGRSVPIETTATTELLRFNSATASLPRFELVDRFLNPQSREAALRAYDESVRGTEIYTHDRFGTAAIPFDLVVPGRGRGTLRVARKAIIVGTPSPIFISTKRPVTSVAELAAAIERKLGPNCTLVGKAVSLIGMLSREFVFVFHEGASSYVTRSRAFHRRLAEAGHPLDLRPILRVAYDSWDRLSECNVWLRLPKDFHHPFGGEELAAKSFAHRWRSVGEEQEELLQSLHNLRRPLDLIEFLARSGLGCWDSLASEYRAIHRELESLQAQIGEIKQAKALVNDEWRAAKRHRLEAERRKGEHWRAAIFEKDATEADWEERRRLDAEVHRAMSEASEARRRWIELQDRQDSLVKSEAVMALHERRRAIELEAELKRLKLARQAVIVARGLPRAARRPSAWWFPLVCPKGTWFSQTTCKAKYYLEPLR